MALRRLALGKESFQVLQRFAYAVELIESMGALERFLHRCGRLSGGSREKSDKEADLRASKGRCVGAELLGVTVFLVNEFFLKWRDCLHRGGVRVPIIPGLL